MVSIVEMQADGVISDRIDLADRDRALAGNRLTLRRRMTLYLGGGADDAQIFGFERIGAAILEADDDETRRVAARAVEGLSSDRKVMDVSSEARAGEALALVHARSQGDAEAAVAAVLAAYTLGTVKPPPEKAVLRRVLPR